jgi:Rieske Fe-S protein
MSPEERIVVDDAPAGQGTDKEDINRQRFLAQATVVLGGVVGVGLIVSIAPTLWPKPELINANKGYSPILPAEFAKLKASVDKPLRIYFKKRIVDGYLVEDQDYYVWGVHMTPEEQGKLQAERPDLFDPALRAELGTDVTSMGFIMFSSLCPHLNCKYDWDDGLKGFLCPCHGSQFSKLGVHIRDAKGNYIGPSPRGLDPVPFQEQNGVAQVEWVKYKANEPARIIVAYS